MRTARCLLIFAAMCAAASSLAAVPVETLLEAPGPAGPLKGTMLAPPGGKGPAVLIIPGSGPTDRNGNSPVGISAAPYRLLAEALAARGVTTVRIDKRGLAGSAGATADGDAVTIPDYVSDVHAWISVIRQRTGASCVWLLGHSEGGLIALAAAQQADVCGLILVSAAGRPIGEVLREQLKANPANAPILPPALSAIDALEAGKHVDTSSMPAPLMPLFRPQVQGYLISLFSYDPVQLLKGYAKPVLIVQGLRDIQVREADARLLQQADAKAKLALLPDVNHVLKSVSSDDIKANIATYSDATLPLAPGVAEAIGDFLAANTKASAGDAGRPLVHIRPVRESDAPSLCEAVTAIAAEKWYLATVDGFSVGQTSAFVNHIVANSLPQVIADADGQVVGFCDILPNPAKGFTHVGRLGMGIRSEWRQQGIGRKLLAECLLLARNTGIEKVELEVFGDNLGAMRLYQSFGFTDEGARIRGRKLEGRYQDVKFMALWL
jgi:uncharacterized protein